jgi:hypothetical protein
MEVGIRYGIRDTYKFYKETREHETKLTDDEYGKIGSALFKLLMEKVHEGHEVILPFKLGNIYIRGMKYRASLDKDGRVKGMNISWGKTRKMWEASANKMGLSFNDYVATVPAEERKLVFSFNEETNGYSYKIVWDKSQALAYNRNLYTLCIAKDNKRRLHKAILAGKEYILKN